MIARCFVLFAFLALAMPLAACADSGVARDVSITAARVQAAHVNEVIQSRALSDTTSPDSGNMPCAEEKPHTSQDGAGGQARRLGEEPLGVNGHGPDVSR